MSINTLLFINIPFETLIEIQDNSASILLKKTVCKSIHNNQIITSLRV